MNKKQITLLAALSLAIFGCNDSNDATPKIRNENSKVNQKIYLKDLTTGTKATQVLRDAYYGNWSYFGKKRVVKSQRLDDGTVTSLTVLLNGGEGWHLRKDLEEKFSKEEGKKVEFDCDLKSSTLPYLNDMKVWKEICTIQHENQILAINQMSPDDSGMISKHYETHALFYSTTVTLIDKQLEEERNRIEKQEQAEVLNKEKTRARNDL